jgi:hypothetical protein
MGFAKLALEITANHTPGRLVTRECPLAFSFDGDFDVSTANLGRMLMEVHL